MRVRAISASLGVLALVGALLMVPVTLATAAAPDSVSVTGTFGAAPTVGNPRIGLQGTVTATPDATVAIERSMDPTFSTGVTAWCNAIVNAGLGSWTCGAGAGGMLEHGVNYFRAIATNLDGQLTSAIFSTPATTLNRTPTITSPADGHVTNQLTMTLTGAAYPSTALDVRTPTIQGVPGYPLCAPTSNASGIWSCVADISAIPDGTYGLEVEDLTAFLVNTNNEFTIDRTAPAAPAITSPPTPLTTTLTDHTIVGTGEPGTSVAVYADAALSCTATADGVGDWSCLASLGGRGTYAITATQTDAAGNTSTASPAHSITVINETVLAPMPGTYANPYPVASGTAEPNVTVDISFGTGSCTTTSNPTTGAFACSPNNPLAPTSYQVTALNVDHAEPSAPQNLTVVDGTPTISAPGNSSSTGQLRPTITGTYNGDDVTSITVEHSIDGFYFFPYCTDSAPSGGTWSCTSTTTDFEYGTNEIYANATATATFVGQSTTHSVQRANNPAITTPAAASSHTAIPAVTGTAHPLATIEVRDTATATVLCTTTSSAGGTWACTPATLASGAQSIVAVDTTHGLSSPPRAFSYAPPAPPAPPAPSPTPTPPAPISWSFSLENTGPVGPGATVTITASALPAGSEVTVELHSTPRTLGTTTVGADGVLRYAAVIPADAEPGDHNLVLTLTPPGGVPSTVTQPLVINTPTPAAPDDEEPDAQPEPAAEEPQAPDAGTTAPIRGTLPDVPRTDPAAPTSLTESVPTAMEVVLSPVSVLTAGGMAIALLILVALPTEILNTTISANSRRFGRAFTWFDDTTTRLSEWLAKTFRTTAVPAVLLVALTAIVFSFSDPSVGFDLASLRLFASLGIALFIVTWVASRISEVILEKRFGIQSNLLLNPAALVFAVIGVVIARLLDFSPGFLIGLVIGLDLAANLAEKHRIRAIVVQYSVILGISVAAWLGYSLMVAVQADGPTSVVTAFVHDTLVAVVAEGLTAIAVAMLPLGFLDGKEVFDHSKRLWAGMFVVIGTAFALLVLPNELNGAEVGDLGIWAIVLLGYAAVTLAIWWVLKVTAKYDDDATIENRRVGN